MMRVKSNPNSSIDQLKWVLSIFSGLFTTMFVMVLEM